MTRRPDWPERLAAWAAAARRQPFVWGRADCVLTACDAIAAMTGEDPAARYRGRYRTAHGAVRVIRRSGAASLRALIERLAEEAGLPPIALALAGRGDPLLVQVPHPVLPEALGICMGRWAFVAGPQGLVAEPRERWLAAWRL